MNDKICHCLSLTHSIPQALIDLFLRRILRHYMNDLDWYLRFACLRSISYLAVSMYSIHVCLYSRCHPSLPTFTSTVYRGLKYCWNIPKYRKQISENTHQSRIQDSVSLGKESNLKILFVLKLHKKKTVVWSRSPSQRFKNISEWSSENKALKC